MWSPWGKAWWIQRSRSSGSPRDRGPWAGRRPVPASRPRVGVGLLVRADDVRQDDRYRRAQESTWVGSERSTRVTSQDVAAAAPPADGGSARERAAGSGLGWPAAPSPKTAFVGRASALGWPTRSGEAGRVSRETRAEDVVADEVPTAPGGTEGRTTPQAGAVPRTSAPKSKSDPADPPPAGPAMPVPSRSATTPGPRADEDRAAAIAPESPPPAPAPPAAGRHEPHPQVAGSPPSVPTPSTFAAPSATPGTMGSAQQTAAVVPPSALTVSGVSRETTADVSREAATDVAASHRVCDSAPPVLDVPADTA